MSGNNWEVSTDCGRIFLCCINEGNVPLGHQQWVSALRSHDVHGVVLGPTAVLLLLLAALHEASLLV